ncbi:MAG: AraC family transcriptional regulator [Bacteroidales bacterium]|nr:AraC family transcriptional regulator [Bacteroidales bacterium]
MREIALTGFVQTLFFSLLIAVRRRKEIKDWLLMAFLMLVGAELLYRYLIRTIPESGAPWIVLFDITYWALFGPVTWFYILFTINRVNHFRAVHLLHLIPLAIGLFAISGYLAGNHAYDSFGQFFTESKGLTLVALHIWDSASPLYIVCSLFVLIRHGRTVREYFANTEKKDLRWMRWLITGLLIYISIYYIRWMIETVFQIDIPMYTLNFLPAMLTVYVFIMGFFGYRQTGIFFDDPAKRKARPVSLPYTGNPETGKYEKSGLTDEERRSLTLRLRELMKTRKPYLENDLSINELAGMLDTTLHKLSQTINESFHQNFYDFINTYRIEETKRMLKQPETEQYTIISIAYDCGFSSKSSFYNAFRKNTGITPGAYLKKAKSLQSGAILN